MIQLNAAYIINKTDRIIIMREDQDLKLTDLDYLIGDNHLQMMKAALPYVNVTNQKRLSLFVKMHELRRTISLFQDEEVATMGICSLEKKPTSPFDMLEAIKPYANTYEQSIIELLSSVVQGFRTPHTPHTGENDFTSQNSILEQFRNILPPEQQSRLETMQFLLQTMQQIT